LNPSHRRPSSTTSLLHLFCSFLKQIWFITTLNIWSFLFVKLSIPGLQNLKILDASSSSAPSLLLWATAFLAECLHSVCAWNDIFSSGVWE
jgi:hypothetical protein